MNHFFDVGANIGQTFWDFLNPRPEFDGWEIWCFEPSPRHLGELMHTAKNQAGRYSIHVCPFGLSGSTCVHKFYMKDDPRGDSFEEDLSSDHQTQNVDTEYSVYVSTVNAGPFILDHTGFDDEIVLKLDCEGSEYNILAALLYEPNAIKRLRQIFVEWHRIGSKPSHSTQELRDAYQGAGKVLENWMF